MRLLIAASVILTILLEPAVAQTATSKSVVAGKAIKLSYFLSVDPGCKSTGYPEVRLTTAPQIGKISLKRGRDFSGFPSANVRSACNTRASPSVQVWYATPRGSSGTDRVGLLALFPDGSKMERSYTVTIYP